MGRNARKQYRTGKLPCGHAYRINTKSTPIGTLIQRCNGCVRDLKAATGEGTTIAERELYFIENRAAA